MMGVEGLICNHGVLYGGIKGRCNNWNRHYRRIVLLNYLSFNDNLFPTVNYTCTTCVQLVLYM